MPSIRAGQKAPNFKLNDKDGGVHQLQSPGADFTVLYFYPKDSTPGCTLEAQEFTATLKDFKARGARVIGVSGGDGSSKAKFCSKYKLNVPLVSDTDFKVAKSFGAYGDKKFMGRSFKGIFRKTFILDSKGTVVKVFESVKPEGHATEVLKAIDAMTRTGGTTKKAVAKKAATKKTPVKKAPVKKATVKKATVKIATAKRTPAQTKAAPSSRKATARAAQTSSRKTK